jgi:hypothetical protein
MWHPSRLDAALFEMPSSDHDGGLRTLSDGLRLFGDNLATLQQAETSALLFQKASEDVIRAADVLHRSGSLANDRAASAMNHLKRHCTISLSSSAMCISEIHSLLLNERETLRTNRSGIPPDVVSEGYSRMGDVLTFMANHETDLMACIQAHRAIQEAYAMAAAPVPALHYRHRKKRGCKCVFMSYWCEPP